MKSEMEHIEVFWTVLGTDITKTILRPGPKTVQSLNTRGRCERDSALSDTLCISLCLRVSRFCWLYLTSLINWPQLSAHHCHLRISVSVWRERNWRIKFIFKIKNNTWLLRFTLKRQSGQTRQERLHPLPRRLTRCVFFRVTQLPVLFPSHETLSTFY